MTPDIILYSLTMIGAVCLFVVMIRQMIIEEIEQIDKEKLLENRIKELEAEREKRNDSS